MKKLRTTPRGFQTHTPPINRRTSVGRGYVLSRCRNHQLRTNSLPRHCEGAPRGSKTRAADSRPYGDRTHPHRRARPPGAPVQEPPTAYKLPLHVIARSAATRLRSRSRGTSVTDAAYPLRVQSRAGTTDCVQTCSSVLSAAYAVGGDMSPPYKGLHNNDTENPPPQEK